MRILLVCTDADIGGAERFLATLARSRRPEDEARLVVLMDRGTLSDQLEAAFDEVVYLAFPPSSRNLTGMIRALDRQIAEYRPDIVSSHLFHADLVTALTHSRCPKTSTIHTQGFGPSDHPLTKLIARAVGALSFRFEAVIPASDSPAMGDFIRSLGMRNVVAPILNGADIPDRPEFDPHSRTFVSIARNHPVKGHTILFDAFTRIADVVPEWSLRAVGPGVLPQDPAMQAALGERGGKLRDAGRIALVGSTSTPDRELAGAAALVISSTYGEAFPIVGAEAAGLGIPVITTDVGSCPEFADDKSFVVPPGDASTLASAMLRYARLDDRTRTSLSTRARTRAESRYNGSSVYDAYRRLFVSLTRDRTSS